MDTDRLAKQIEFIVEIDKLKGIVRQTLLTDGSKQEDSAEHSWHIAVIAIVLCEYAKEPVDLHRVLKMVLIHDLVEIDAGDTYCHDEEANKGKAELELKAADRIFNLLPKDQGGEFRSLWQEFEERKTPEARFAAALDRLQPLLNDFTAGGLMWKKHGVFEDQVYRRNSPIEEGAPGLWEYAAGIIRHAAREGWIRK